MRELKFRVWNKTMRQYRHFVLQKGVSVSIGADLEIEQYTGLKDQNGKEIYEGDIVDYAGECTCVIQYEDEGARFIHRDISDDFPFGFNGLEEYNGKLFEVIGNIHENPELLESKNAKN